MGQIRRQTVLSSLSTYFGFGIGALNTYLFVHKGVTHFTPEEYGLTRIFTDVGQMIYAFGSLGVASVLYKFYPYYKDHLARKDNDLLTWALVLSMIGFLAVLVAGWWFEPLIVRKFSARSLLFVVYYKWVFPFGLGYLLFTVLEAFAVAVRQSVVSTFMREGLVRLFVLVMILPYLFNWISFDTFIKLFALQYLAVALALLLYLSRQGLVAFTFRVSKVTCRFRKKIASMLSLVYGGVVIQIVAQAFDGVLIAALVNLKFAGIYTFLLYIANIIQVPQRSVQSVTIPHLAQAWKDKDMGRINRIYHRTSINLLILSSTLFCLIWLCTPDAFAVFPIQEDYKQGLNVILLLGLARIIDAGMGVNSQIIGTSVYWRFEFFTGVLLLSLRIPLNIILIKAYGITGSAVADMFSLVVYNCIRLVFLARRFGMQPFTYKTLLALVFAAGAFILTYWVCSPLHGWVAIGAKILMFTVLYGVLAFRLTPDAYGILPAPLKRWLQ